MEFEIDSRLANAFIERSYEEAWPVDVRLGVPFRSENGNRMVCMRVKCESDFGLNEKLSETINRLTKSM